MIVRLGVVTLRKTALLPDAVSARGRHFYALNTLDNAKIKGITVSVYRIGRGGVCDFFAIA